MFCRIAIAVLFLSGPAGGLRADDFERYVGSVLAKAPGAPGVEEVKQLTASRLVAHDRVLRDAAGALLVVKTNGGRYAKLLVQAGRRKAEGGRFVPLLRVEQFVTYREGEDRAAEAQGRNLELYPGFRVSLDLGQVVPPELAADLRVVADGMRVSVGPVGGARLYLVTRPLFGNPAGRLAAAVAGPVFEPRFFNGSYRLHDDGRRTGTLTLRAADDGAVSGEFVSEKEGRRYEVAGKVGSPRHAVDFRIKFPRTEEDFHGWLFTGDGRAIAGFSKIQGREAGFYALRAEGE